MVRLDDVSTPLDDDDDAPKKPSRATIIRRVLVFTLALACAGALLYTRVLVKKGTLGDACSYDMHCKKEAPRCLKQEAEGEGVCSRPCDDDQGCAPGIVCVKVSLDEYDERGKPLEGGYCFPQALLDARKKKPAREAAAPKDSWVDVPETPGQLEGEFTLERAGGSRTTVEIKGTLLRTTSGKSRRTVVDTAALRVYAVDDDKKTFAAAQIAALPAEVVVTKTDQKDRVADHDCEIWRVEETGPTGTKTSREACVAKGGAFVDPAARAVSPWEKELAVRGVFPLRVVDVPAKGDKPRLVVTKIEARSLDASLFAIPKDYKNLASR